MGETVNPGYRTYHPKWHRDRIPIFWWLRSATYVKFIARELTSLPVAYAAALLVIHARAVWRGAASYARFLAWLESAPVIALHAVVAAGLIFHTVTWLGLAPKAIVLRLGGRRVPDIAVLLGHYAAWMGLSAVIAWGVLAA